MIRTIFLEKEALERPGPRASLDTEGEMRQERRPGSGSVGSRSGCQRGKEVLLDAEAGGHRISRSSARGWVTGGQRAAGRGKAAAGVSGGEDKDRRGEKQQQHHAARGGCGQTEVGLECHG